MMNKEIDDHIRLDQDSKYQSSDFFEVIFDNTDWTDVEKASVAEYVGTKVCQATDIHIPEVSLYGGQAFLSQQNFEKAAGCLEEAKLQFEAYGEEGLDGIIVYVQTLIQLAYVYQQLGKGGQATVALLQLAMDSTDEFWDEDGIGIGALQSYENGPASFQTWFDEHREEVHFA